MMAGEAPSPMLRQETIVLPTATGSGPQPPGQISATAHPGATFERLATGSSRLDALLGGGFPAGSATLLYGPPFSGKQVLQRLAFAAAACRGIPATFILHGVTAEAMSRSLRCLHPDFADAEKAGVVSYVDAHSQFLGEPTTHPNAVYLEDPNDTATLVKALDGRTDFPSGAGLVAIQSASTAIIDLGPGRAFQMLRSVLGRTLKAGGVGLVSLETGMHPESEVQMAKHVCASMIEMRKKRDSLCLHVEGLETTVPKPGWVEYDFSPRSFRVTGGFAARTIR